MSSSTTAPCIAVVGPPNSGKTTLLSLLDEILQNHPDQRRAYVVKGSPDGTARYFSNAPELREKLKGIVKGAWSEETAQIICDWIDSCCSCLDLVLLDMGGKHDPKNDSILSRCSHYLVVSRLQGEDGRRSWIEACEKHAPLRVGDLRSVIEAGEPGVIKEESLTLLFRSDPGLDPVANRPIVAPLLARLLELRHEGTAIGYLDLRLGRNWIFDDLANLAGLDTALDRMITDHETVRLGGRAPV